MTFRKQHPFIWLGIIATFHFFYYPSWNAGFVTDFTGLLARLEDQSAWGILNCFGFPALEQVLNAFLYLFYKLFGTSPLPWYLIHTSFHILNAYLCYQLVKQLILFSRFSTAHVDQIALMSALLFLFSPYQSEVITWRVCFNFLISTALITGSLLFLIRWLMHKKRQDFWKLQWCFLICLFTFELGLMIPFMGLAIYLLFAFPSPKAGKVFIPQFILLGIYFLLNRLILGQWIGHYGAETHLRFPLKELMGNFFNYSIKLLGFVRYYEHPWKEYIFGLVDKSLYFYAVLSLIIVGFFTLIYLVKKGYIKPKLLMAFGVLYFLALAPILNLHFNYLLFIENDRYNYLASVFFFPFLVLLIHLLPRLLFWTVSVLFLSCSIYFVHLTNQQWKASTEIYNNLLDTFDAEDAPAVLLLNLPDNMNGAVMFRDYSRQNRAFKDALYHLKGKVCAGEVYDVALYNMTRPTDGATYIQAPDSSEAGIEFNQWGNWWWRGGIGMGNGYKTAQFEVINNGHHYVFKPLDLPEGSVLLIQNGSSWKKYTLSTSNVLK